MTTNKKTDEQTQKDLSDQIDALLKEAQEVTKETDSLNEESNKEIGALEMKVDESIANVEQIYAELDTIEKETGDELDRLVLEQAQDLAVEE